MKKKIVSFISFFILTMLVVAVLPEEKADAASSVTITSIDVVESSVDVSSGATTVTVNVGVNVNSLTEKISSIGVRLDNMGGSTMTLTGSKTTGLSGTGIYPVTVTIPGNAYGRFVVMTVAVSGTEGSSDFQGSVSGYDTVYVYNNSIDVIPPYTRSVDAEWVKLVGGRYLKVMVWTADNSGINQVGTIMATFQNENGKRLEVSGFSKSMDGYYYALVKESDIKENGTYDLTQLIVHDTSGNEALYYFPDQSVTINGNVRRSFPSRLEGTSFTVGSSSQQSTTAAVSDSTIAASGSEPKSPTTGQNNSVVAALAALVCMGTVVVCFGMVIKKRITR